MIFKLLLAVIGIATALRGAAQDIYFPPTVGTEWETIDMATLGWCPDKLPPLYDYLEAKNSKAFIVLKDGKIVIEKYYDSFTADSLWYWASAGKCLTSVLVGIAQEEGLLSITDPTADYLGAGWTNCTTEQEAAITIRNQLTMTTGLDYGVADIHCTDPACLTYLAAPNEQWYYHNAPYTLLDGVISNATGVSLNSYCNSRVESITGMSGIFVPIDFNNVYFSKARDMARFGLMILNDGYWDETGVLTDATYFNEMVNTSQSLNQSYGYLWWLNGKASYMLPSSTSVFPGSALPNAPDDMISALGKNGQIINIVPSQNLVVIRMGDSPDGIEAMVPTIFDNTIWDYLNQLMCESSSVNENELETPRFYPNPTQNVIEFNNLEFDRFMLIDNLGNQVYEGILTPGIQSFDVSFLARGIYHIILTGATRTLNEKLILE